MNRPLTPFQEGSTKYFKCGDHPTLLIISGTHGDEYGVIDSVKKAVEKYTDTLPDFIFIPEASPSAVAARTRVNGDGVDLNRNYKEGTNIVEARTIMDIIREWRLEAIADFHEDLECPHFYIYDSFAGSMADTDAWHSVQDDVRALGIELLNGIDDPSDPALGFEFVNGYHYFPPESARSEDGVIQDWAYTQGLIQHYLNPEIPGAASREVKDAIVDSIFRNLLVKND